MIEKDDGFFYCKQKLKIGSSGGPLLIKKGPSEYEVIGLLK